MSGVRGGDVGKALAIQIPETPFDVPISRMRRMRGFVRISSWRKSPTSGEMFQNFVRVFSSSFKRVRVCFFTRPV